MIESNGASSSTSHLPVIQECVESNAQDELSEEFDFGDLSSSDFPSSSYISFGAPVFSSNVFVNQPNCIDPSVMASSQNFNTFNYPVFKKYGYYINGVYYTMVKKGSTRDRVKCLYRRGTPRLDTIQEEPEQEDKENVEKKVSARAKEVKEESSGHD